MRTVRITRNPKKVCTVRQFFAKVSFGPIIILYCRYVRVYYCVITMTVGHVVFIIICFGGVYTRWCAHMTGRDVPAEYPKTQPRDVRSIVIIIIIITIYNNIIVPGSYPRSTSRIFYYCCNNAIVGPVKRSSAPWPSPPGVWTRSTTTLRNADDEYVMLDRHES